MIHTVDLTHSSKPAEFDTLDQVLVGAKRQVFYVPGEHDTSIDDGKMHLIGMVRAPREMLGTASITRASTLSDSLMWSGLRAWAS